ncbi:hypothetical protein [Zhengella mangrovi]|uniref:hypothetical protein n=1 Tax=Zhengella mangrovi TaxID=1982044 RepID=UPI0010548030|nr:hypothetical protein [Zhengella mangrovi]
MMVSDLVRAFHARSADLDNAIRANDPELIGELDRQIGDVWRQLLAARPEAKGELRQLVEFFLTILAPNAQDSDVEADAMATILALFDDLAGNE